MKPEGTVPTRLHLPALSGARSLEICCPELLGNLAPGLWSFPFPRIDSAAVPGNTSAPHTMFGRTKKSKGLYYLLPGMTRANREKRRRIMNWSLAVGLLTAGALATLIWFLNRP